METSGEVLRTPSEVWEYLTTDGGLQPRSWDLDLAEDLLTRIDSPPDGDELQRIVASRVTTEDFIVAFLSTLEPYALMLGDLLRLFEQHGVKATDRNAAITFDFSRLGETDLVFDLESVRLLERRGADCQGDVSGTARRRRSPLGGRRCTPEMSAEPERRGCHASLET
jgi:hypothetical protein